VPPLACANGLFGLLAAGALVHEKSTVVFTVSGVALPGTVAVKAIS
jgi:hypothetical protein